MTAILLSILALVLLYGGVCLWVYSNQENWIFRPDKLTPEVDLALSPPHVERWFEVENGISLDAAHLKVNDPKGLILYHHGNSGDLTEWKKVADLFLPHGFDVLVYDYRGYGRSGAKIESEEQLYRDGLKIYQQMKQEYVEERILLYGRSLGTGIASYIAANAQPGCLILETPFYSMKDLVRRYHPWLPLSSILKYPLRNDLHLEKVSCPIHIFHGDRDRVTDHRSALRLKKFLKPNDRFHTIQGGHHEDLSKFDAFHEALKEALAAFPERRGHAGKVRNAS